MRLRVARKVWLSVYRYRVGTVDRAIALLSTRFLRTLRRREAAIAKEIKAARSKETGA